MLDWRPTYFGVCYPRGERIWVTEKIYEAKEDDIHLFVVA